MEHYRRLLRFVRPYWWIIAIAVILSLFVSLFSAAQAWLFKPVLDDIFIKKDVEMLKIIPPIVIALLFFKGIFGYLYSYLMRYVGARVVTDLRRSLYSHLVLLPLGFFTKNPTGSLISRMTNDIGTVQSVLANSVKDLFVEGFTMIALIGVAFYRKWDLAIIAILVLPFTALIVIKLGVRLRKISRTVQDKMADLTSALSETFTGIKMVKAFGMEEFEAKRFDEKNKRYLNIFMKITRISEIPSPVMEFIGVGLGVAFVVWYGGGQVIKGTTSAGTFFSFMAAVIMLYTPIRRLGQVNINLQQAIGASERVFQILDTKSEVYKGDGIKELPPIKEGIEFRDVSFHYEDRKRNALSGINLSIRAGEIIALIGVSGVGKTTLVNLIPRFYDPTEGQILIDGIDISEVTLESLREKTGIVSQETILFNDTVRDNIAYGRIGAEDDLIIEAAKAAYAHDFIMEMPHGYDTIIGEKGVRLSGGQKQRIAIARALLKNPPILILDEATSSLDTASELMVQEALKNLMKDRTTFVIAHRLSTILMADRIVVIDRGKIVEMGSHEELLRKDGIYKRLYSMQFEARTENLEVRT
jgi:subfamily B ATP-binding cassette protein MsbA